jgi:hypothetical protein
MKELLELLSQSLLDTVQGFLTINYPRIFLDQQFASFDSGVDEHNCAWVKVAKKNGGDEFVFIKIAINAKRLDLSPAYTMRFGNNLDSMAPKCSEKITKLLDLLT